MYAVIESGGKQYRVELGSKIQVDRLDVQPGDAITLDRVLLVADGDDAAIGQPLVDGAVVSAEVLGQDRGDKIIVFKYKPKARTRVKQGHRSELTTLRISDIAFGGKSAAKVAVSEEKARAKAAKEAEKAAAEQATADQALAAKLADAEAAPKPKTRKRTTRKKAAAAEPAAAEDPTETEATTEAAAAPEKTPDSSDQGDAAATADASSETDASAETDGQASAETEPAADTDDTDTKKDE